MRVLVTRPAAQAHDWVRQLQAEGIAAAALPLIAITAPADAAPLAAAWPQLARRQLLVFVSPNAVAAFFAARPAALVWPASTLAASPGPGTSAALRAAGVADALIVEPAADARQFDSEALWAVLEGRRAWAGASVLVVRGSVGAEAEGSGREWLVQQLRARGAEVETLAAYRRAAPQLDAAQRALWQQAMDAPAEHVWLFSSSEAIEQLAVLVPAGPRAWRAAQALATHPRIAERARVAGFGRVIEAAPAVAAVVQALRALQARR